MKRLVFLSLAMGLGACQDPSQPEISSNQNSSNVQATTPSKRPVPDQYIVVFRRDVADAASVARDLATKHKAKLKHVYTAALKGMTVQLPQGAIAALQRNPTVEYVEQDQVVELDGELIVQPGATRGLDRVDQRFLPLSGSYSYSADGAGVRVYIIDSGIHYGHTEFAGRALFGFDALGGNGGDCNGHGTHVAGTAGGTTYGVTKKVQLYSIRVFDCAGSSFASVIIAGVDWVTKNRVLPAVANMSLGGSFSSAVNLAVSNSIATGITYVVAAGNSFVDACSQSPASTPAALTVAATDVSDAFAYFSNFGSCVDIVAPGVSITSSWIGSQTATRTIDGTSMASPHVAGAAALYLSANPGATPSQVSSALRSNGTAGILNFVPPGTPNLLLYTNPSVSTSWAPRSPLPTARRGVAIWVANNLLYAIGGTNSTGTVLRTVEAYNTNTNSWTTRALLPAARQGGNGAATINNILYLPGGHDAVGLTTRTLYAYNPSTNTWASRASMPVFSSCGGSAAIAGKLYVFSGCTRSSRGAQVAAALLHRYDPATNTWATLRAAPATHFQPMVTVTGGKLYVVGGNNGSGAAFGRVDRYDPAANTWSLRATMPTARVAAAGVAINGRVHVMGGRNGTTYLNTVEVYDPLSNSWTTRPSMPTPRAALGVAGISGFLYAVGGRNGSTIALGTNERFTP
jgi:subtilisin family serine protease